MSKQMLAYTGNQDAESLSFCHKWLVQELHCPGSGRGDGCRSSLQTIIAGYYPHREDDDDLVGLKFATVCAIE